jgi:hypothetical protein
MSVQPCRCPCLSTNSPGFRCQYRPADSHECLRCLWPMLAKHGCLETSRAHHWAWPDTSPNSQESHHREALWSPATDLPLAFTSHPRALPLNIVSDGLQAAGLSNSGGDCHSNACVQVLVNTARIMELARSGAGAEPGSICHEVLSTLRTMAESTGKICHADALAQHMLWIHRGTERYAPPRHPSLTPPHLCVSLSACPCLAAVGGNAGILLTMKPIRVVVVVVVVVVVDKYPFHSKDTVRIGPSLQNCFLSIPPSGEHHQAGMCCRSACDQTANAAAVQVINKHHLG